MKRELGETLYWVKRYWVKRDWANCYHTLPRVQYVLYTWILLELSMSGLRVHVKLARAKYVQLHVKLARAKYVQLHVKLARAKFVQLHVKLTRTKFVRKHVQLRMFGET